MKLNLSTPKEPVEIKEQIKTLQDKLTIQENDTNKK